MASAQPRWYSVLWSQQIASASVIHEITQSPPYLNHSEYNFNPDSSCPGRGSGSFKMRILEHLEDPCQRKMSRLRNWVSDRLRATVVWFGLGLDEAWAIIAGEPPGGKLGLSVNLLDSRRFFYEKKVVMQLQRWYCIIWVDTLCFVCWFSRDAFWSCGQLPLIRCHQ